MPDVTVRIARPHNWRLDWHEWIFLGERIRANRLGHPNPRMHYPEWQRWICNNTECGAWALIHDQAIRDLLHGHDADTPFCTCRAEATAHDSDCPVSIRSALYA